MILKCTRYCRNAYQDVRYGFGKRVHNKMFKDVHGQKGARCTVCRTERVRHGSS